MSRWSFALLLLFTPVLVAQTTTTAPTSDATVKVTRGSLPILIEDEGVFEPAEALEIRVKPRVFAGELAIKSIVKPNTPVKAGDPLLELDDKTITKDLVTVANEVEAAQANFAKAQADAELLNRADELARKVAETELSNAQTALKWFDEVDGPLMLQQADLQLKMQQYGLDDQNDELDQLRKMYKTEDLTSATADIVIKRSLRQVELSKISIKREEEENRKIKTVAYPQHRQRLAFAVDQQKNGLEQLNAAQAQNAVTRKVALATAGRAVEDAEQKLADLKADALLFKQTAAVDGVVYYGQFVNRSWSGNDPKSFAVGEKLTAGNIVLTVVTPGKLRVAMDLPEENFSAVRPGMAATVVPVSQSQKIAGKTQTPSSIAKATGLELLIKLPPVSGELTPGMKARVFIDAGKTENVLLVPSEVISDGKVWIKQDGEPVAKRVLTGRTVDEQTEIIDGLSEGDVVLEEAPQ